MGVVAGVVVLSAAAPAAACAQASSDSTRFSATVEMTAARAHFEEFLPSIFVGFAPEARVDLGNTLVLARGSVARFAETGNLNLQGVLGIGTFTRRLGSVRGELAGLASFGSHEGLGRSGTAQALVRAHVEDGPVGGWAGVSGGWSALGGGIGVATWRGDLGAWARVGGARATLVLQPTRVGELRYTTLDGGVRWTQGRVELGMEGGFRAGDRTIDESTGSRMWAAGDIVYWASDRMAMVVGSGRFLADPVTNSIGGRYTSVGVRLGTQRARAVRSRDLPRVLLPRRAAAPPADGAAAEQLEVLETAAGGITFRLRLPGARSAEIMGDFTEWEAIALQPAGDDLWETTVVLEPGVHRMNLRTDGGDWRVPPDLTAVDDGFGGRVGLVVVRR